AARIARYGEEDIARLMADTGIVRNRLKVEATIANARALLKLQERTSLAAFLWGAHGRPAAGQRAPHRPVGAGPDAGLQGHVEGAAGARVPLRRPDHGLCLHAGRRHGQRPPDGLPPIPTVREPAEAVQAEAEMKSDP